MKALRRFRRFRAGALAALATVAFAPAARASTGFTTTDTLGPGDVGKELANNTVYKVESDLTLTNTGTGPGLSVARGATVVLYIKKGVTLTVTGGNSSGRSAGDAGLRVLSGRTLVVTGGGKLVATGGNAGNGVNGGDAGACSLDMSGNSHGGHGGAGGNGGAGASAGIGGYGGYGGYGGSRPADESWVETNDSSDYDRNGNDGNSGAAGGNGDDMGTVYLLGSVNVTATGGSGGSGGSPGSNTGGEHDSNWSAVNWYYVGGGGGGGGGAGGIAAPYAIGGGGGGGGGGGSGGNGGLFWKGSWGTGSTDTPDGAGGQGGWDNGVSASRTSPVTVGGEKHGGSRGSGGAKGANGGNGTLYRDSGVTLNATYASSTSASTHSAIEYTLSFEDDWRIAETRGAKLGYALPAAPVPAWRERYTFLGWFTQPNAQGIKYYNADGSAARPEYDRAGDLALYAGWRLDDDSPTVWVNGTGIVPGQSQAGDGWSYDSATGQLSLSTAGATYTVSGVSTNGEIAILVGNNPTVVLDGLVLDTGIRTDLAAFEIDTESRPTVRVDASSELASGAGMQGVRLRSGASVRFTGDATLLLTGGDGAADVGCKQWVNSLGPIRIDTQAVDLHLGTGRLANDTGYTNHFYSIPTGAMVWNVAVTNFAPGAAVSWTGLEEEYTPTNTTADAHGIARLWLPDGTWLFDSESGGVTKSWVVHVDGAHATAYPFTDVGLTINGRAVSLLTGEGWYHDRTNTVVLTGPGPFVVSGSTASGIGIRADASCSVVLSNVLIDCSAYPGRNAFRVPPGVSVDFALPADAALVGGAGCAGLSVPAGAAATFDGAGMLSATAAKPSSGLDGGAGIGGDNGEAGGTIEIRGGEITARTTCSASGIGGGKSGAGGTVTISGGTVLAEGRQSGIGGGYGASGGTTTISAGTVTAHAALGAGIGAGNRGADGGRTTISGGIVTAAGGTYGAGIGGASDNGTGGDGGIVVISGGTVFPSGRNGSSDIGIGRDGSVGTASTTISGGSVRATGALRPLPWSNAGRIYCVTVSGFEPGAAVTLDGLDSGAIDAYGDNDLYADEDGKIYLWLPNGTYRFAARWGANHETYIANVSDANVDAAVWRAGVTVNGVDVAALEGEGWEYDGLVATLHPTNAAPLVVAGTNLSAEVRLAVAHAGEVVLSNLVLDVSSRRGAAAIDIQAADGAATLRLAGENRVKSGEEAAGVQCNDDDALVIDGDGTLVARGGGYAAGIGGGYQRSGGTIAITNATVDATGGSNGAGIGGGWLGAGGTVTVSGATVTATGTGSGAGIGGGGNAAGGVVTIAGGVVKATGHGDGAGIGGGSNGADGGTVTIVDGDVTANGGLNAAGIGGGAGGMVTGSSGHGATVAISGGTVTAKGGTNGAGIGGGQYGNGGRTEISGGTVTATGGDEGAGIGAGRMGAGGTVVISGGEVTAVGGDDGESAELHSGGAGIGGGLLDHGSVTITGGTVSAQGGTNAAGIGGGTDGDGGTIAISGDATVTAQGGENGAGIGGGKNGTAGTIRIEGGTVTATGAYGGAGVGGGYHGDGVTIAISGGTVTATGGENGAGIGGGSSAGANITISGGTVNAMGGHDGAGIGGGFQGDPITITISGDAEVTATSESAGAGIGGGYNRSGGTITIESGVVAATGGGYGAGIGGGIHGTGGTIKILGGTVTAAGGPWGAGIGGGYQGDGGSIDISDGTVTARGGTSTRDEDGGAGIGGGAMGSGGNITISGGAVAATGGDYGAGIGGGNYHGSGNITISGGTVTATAGTRAAGIGGGDNGLGDTIKISGGRIRAVGSYYGASIGGAKQAGGNISISGGTLHVETSAPWTIGNGRNAGSGAAANLFTGGAIYTTRDRIAPVPVNSTPTNVFPLDLGIGLPTNRVAEFIISGTFASYYGTRDLYTDERGVLRIWLPSTGGELFTVEITMEDGSKHFFCYGIKDDGTIVQGDFLVVNEQMVVAGRSDYGWGWNYDKDTCVLRLYGNATVHGVSTNGGHRILVPAGGASRVTLTGAGLTLSAANTKYWSAFVVSNDCELVLGVPAANSLHHATTNAIAARGQYAAGIEVAEGASLTIRADAPADELGECPMLAAFGGKCGAGIGSRGSGYVKPGKITIESGIVLAQGGEKAAGIGGGSMCTLAADNIVLSGGIVTAIGGASAAGIGSGYVGGGGGDKTLPDGAVRITGGTVLSTRGASGDSDLISSKNTVSASGGSKALVITGGSVHGANLSVAPDPVDAAGAQLRYWLFEGLEPGATPVFGEGLPAGYGLSGVVADATGSVCLWLPSTNAVRSVILDGKYFSGGGATNNVFSIESGSDEPPDSIREDGRTKWRVAVPALLVGETTTILGLEDAGVSSAIPGPDGRAFLYMPDGDYAFSAGGFDYAAAVAGAAVDAELLRVGVAVNGVDAAALGGEGWAFLPGEHVLALTNAGPFAISGAATNVGIRAEADCAATLGGLALTNGAARLVPFECGGRAVALSLASTNVLVCAVDGLPGIRAAGASALVLSEAAEGASLGVLGGRYAAAIGGGAGEAAGAVAIEGGAVTAQGGYYGAGIGGGNEASGGTIAIRGGTVAATGGQNGAGIGGGRTYDTPGGADGGDITIEGGTVTATGGFAAAGIGGGLGGPGGTIRILGGSVRAIGHNLSAGIGGSCAPGGTIEISGGTVRASSSSGAGIGGGNDSAGGTITISGGEVTASSSAYGAGIGGGYGGAGGTIAISGGVVKASASDGAGIGGGRDGAGGTIGISGGAVEAIAQKGAGIGGGHGAAAGTIEISGGIVAATCFDDSAAIGGGCNGTGGTVAISGGTVTATGYNSDFHVGSGNGGSVQSVAFSGGSIHTTPARVSPAATNLLAKAVNPVDFLVGAANVRIETFSIDTPPLDYGANDLYTDENGILRAWLPDGRWLLDLKAEGGETERWLAVVDGENSLAARYAPGSVGFFVNGADVGEVVGEGWTFDTVRGGLTLSGDGPFELSGTLTNATVAIAANCAVTLSNAVVDASAVTNAGAIHLASGVTATLSLVGENAATGGVGRAGVTVPAGATLTIDKSNLSTLQPFNLSTLAAAGGEGAAGVGGDDHSAAGTIRIEGGTLVAQAGAGGAGIGSGDHGSGGSVEISGGVVTAVSGGEDAYAIGSGAGNGAHESDFNFITISGGTVFLETSRPDRAIGSLPNVVASNQRSVHIRGGSVWAGRETVSPDPRSYDNTLVFPVDVDLGRPDSPVTASIPLVSGDSTVDYGMTDVRTDANGVVRFWLPEGNSIAEIDGRYYQISVGRERSWARPWNSALAVNGVNISEFSGEGWTFDFATMSVHLTGVGPFELSGEESGASVSVENDCDVVLRDVTLATGENGLTALHFGDGVTATLELVGTNSLASGQYHPGLGIAKTASLAIRGDGFLSAAGGEHGAGIGGGSCGSFAIEGGVIVAQGGRNGAGIGGGNLDNSYGSCGTIVISGGDVTAIGGGGAPGIGQAGRSSDGVGSILVSGGVVTATGGYGSSGIGGCYYPAVPVTISGGVVTATGGELGAGIGGGQCESADVTISGGVVTATGGYHGAGIGGGEGSYGVTYSAGTVRISGGIVSATAGEGAHGIGGGYLSDRGSVEITGGTVAAAGGEGGMDVGIVGPSGVAGSVVFGGGSILADMAKVKPAPKNAGGTAVWRVDVATGIANAPVVNLEVRVRSGDSYESCSYGTNDICSDENGEIHLWLPDGEYTITVDGTEVTKTVDGSSVFIPLGVAVDGVDVGHGSGPNWTLDAEKRIVLAGACVVSGSNTLDGVSIRIATSEEVVFSNACIRSSLGFKVATNVQAVVRGVGRNVVRSTYYDRAFEQGAGLAVAGGTFEFRIEDTIAILGGSVSGISTYYASPTNATGARVYPADIKGFGPGEAVGPLQGLPAYYDTTEIFADDAGEVHLWLPEGTYVATNVVDGAKWTIRIGPEGETTVVAWNDDFTVNGVNIAALSGDGWNYANGVLTLAGIEHYTLHGTNVVGGVRVLVAADATVELSGVSVRSERPFALGDGVAATVLLSGPGNALVSTYSSNAGLFVPHSASLTITNATDDARLYACGGRYGAGIGANSGQSDRPGDITIAGGIVEARPSETSEGYAAGIGAGFAGYSGRIRITGGRVYAYGSQNGSGASAGIGGSAEPYDDSNGLIEISGGTVYACGGSVSVERIGADIGDGTSQRDMHDNRNAVVITGGSVVLAHFGSEKGGFTQSRTDEENLPHDAAGRVLHAVVVPLGTPDAAVTGLVLPASAGSYGTRDLYADANGDLYLWLPDGDYAFTVDGARWTATVAGADTVAVPDYVSPESLHIEAIEVAPGSVTLTVSAEPDGWITAETAPLLRVRASETLPVSAGDLLDPADVAATLDADGAVILVLPSPAPSACFYRVELP